MKNYGIDMQGKLQVERVSSTPSWSTDEQGRIVLQTTTGKVYITGIANTAPYEVLQLIDNALFDANTILVDNSAGGSTPEALTVDVNSLVGRTATNIESISVDANSLVGRAAGDIEDIAIGTNEIVARAAGNIDGIAISANSLVGRTATNIESISVDTNSLVGRVAGDIEDIAIGTNSLVGRTATNIESISVDANSLVGRAAGDIEDIAIGTNEIVARAAGNIDGIAIGTNEIVARDDGNIDGIAISTNEIVARAAGNIDGIAVGDSQIVGRKAGGNLAGLTIAEVNTLLNLENTIMPRGYIAGLILSNGTDTEYDIDIANGECKDSTNTVKMVLTAKTRQLDAAFGTGNGGVFSGATTWAASSAYAWYYVFVIAKTDGTVDVGFDSSKTCANLPTGYTYFRRIGAIVTDSSKKIRQFQQSGDEFLWYSPVQDYGSIALNTTRTFVNSIPPLSVGVRWNAQKDDGRVNITHPSVTWTGAPATVNQSGSDDWGFNGSSYARTDDSGQLKFYSSNGGAFYFTVLSFIDDRGKDD